MAKDYKKNLQKRLNLKNINAVPTLETVIVNMGIGSIVTRKGHKDFEEFEKNLSKITGQKPRIVKAKKSISNFKLREGMPVMLQSTLRGNRALDFIDRLYKIILPRIRDFSGLNKRSFDSQANLTIGIKNYSIFPELGLDDVTIPMGIGITIVTSTNNQEKSIALLEELGFVFK
ncbi:MAG TPA: 50S ribosomal protein L5 [Candidatus Absconditabacterales bacterium]|nr:50S ribosomal protein L5 [Candidatus Absconditabacterales bacterium]HOQ79032.1 50S ribosomal protein L5 [Candidatus Absconditabacterales bacterium]HPK27634.1 50S ribosomal protein L5 [Candidatus Absconditabacterales bacterium]